MLCTTAFGVPDLGALASNSSPTPASTVKTTFGNSLQTELEQENDKSQDDDANSNSQSSVNNRLNQSTTILLGMALGVLVLMLIVGRVLSKKSEKVIDPAIVRTFNRRISSWVLICVALSMTLVFWPSVTVFFFFLVSFWALREFITMTPTRPADHRTLFWVLILFTPLQYVLVGMSGIDETNSIFGISISADVATALAKVIGYEIYTIVIPVYGSLFIAARIAFTGDRKRYLERIAKIQFGLLICVYALSHAPALLYLDLGQRDLADNSLRDWDGSTKGLLFFFVLLVQFSDLMHFICDKLIGRHVIAAKINGTKTWEGLIGAACLTAVAGMLIQLTLNVTPFWIYGAGFMALIISIMGSSGSMTMSAIKRDRGVEDYGTLVTGHAGVLDRIDSMCFAAPIFFHLTRFFLEMK